ncbi:hypothetical protein ACLQ22_09640 [Micromonospora sp. DT178]|uniref:hypothetical protein n=1 Tax=Micromonospora sp. DT178 TaxID=3393436 RepID=UPI003CEC0072
MGPSGSNWRPREWGEDRGRPRPGRRLTPDAARSQPRRSARRTVRAILDLDGRAAVRRGCRSGSRRPAARARLHHGQQRRRRAEGAAHLRRAADKRSGGAQHRRLRPGRAGEGRAHIELHRPLPVAGTVLVTSTVTGMYDKGSGALVEFESVAVDAADGQPLVTARFGMFVRGEGEFGGDRGASAPWQPPDRRESPGARRPPSRRGGDPAPRRSHRRAPREAVGREAAEVLDHATVPDSTDRGGATDGE